MQQPLLSTNTVGYRGVSKNGNKFMTQLTVDGKCKHIGLYITAKEAAIAYDRALLKANKSTTKLNFPGMVHNLDVEPIRKRRKKKVVVAKKKKIRKPYRKHLKHQALTESETSQALEALAAMASEDAARNEGKGSKFPEIKD